jgi:hypothetical protein
MSLITAQDKGMGRAKLGELITKGAAQAANVIDHVMNNQPADHLPKAGSLRFLPNHEGQSITLEMPVGSLHGGIGEVRGFNLHRNAIHQMAGITDMPIKFIDSLREQKGDWARDLLAHNLQTVFHERFAAKRYLTRTLSGEVRGFLSDQYRRIDSRPIVEAFATAVQAKGAMPYAGYVTDTKIAIQAVFPEVYEPIPGEVMAYGLSLENSDFGAGALSIRAYLLRIWCTNMAITDETMRQVHLGRRLDENMVYSQKTYELDSETTVSALKDVIAVQFDAKSLETRMDAVRVANEQEVSPAAAKERLKKLLSKGEAEKASAAFESADTFNLPAGSTTWRLSNAISWIAGSTEDTERKLDLMRIAGAVLPEGRKVA